MQCSKFKSSVFGSLMLSVIALTLLIASIITNEWIKGTARPLDPDQQGKITVNFGLFSGTKVKEKGSYIKRSLSVVCSQGVCMLTCGNSSDLEDILTGTHSQVDTSSGDNYFCDQDSISRFNAASEDDQADEVAEAMISFGMWVSVLFFLFLGLVISIINIIFTVINTAHNPVSSLFGIDGIVVWNLLIALCYLLVLILWGAEFALRLMKNLSISETLRKNGIQWTSDGLADIGYSYWLILPAMFLHLINAGVLGFRQYKLYYAPQSKQTKTLEIKVKEASDGKDMLY